MTVDGLPEGYRGTAQMGGARMSLTPPLVPPLPGTGTEHYRTLERLWGELRDELDRTYSGGIIIPPVFGVAMANMAVGINIIKGQELGSPVDPTQAVADASKLLG